MDKQVLYNYGSHNMVHQPNWICAENEDKNVYAEIFTNESFHIVRQNKCYGEITSKQSNESNWKSLKGQKTKSSNKIIFLMQLIVTLVVLLLTVACVILFFGNF